MQNNQKQEKEVMVATSSRELEALITNAIKKVGAKRENDLCRYLPMASGGYMHHFTYKKKKYQQPEQLADMIQKFILQTSKPVAVAPKRRAARGSRGKKNQFVIDKQEIDRIISLARTAGDKDLLRRLLPKKDLKVLKKELISAIRQNRVEQELWNNFAEAVSQQLISV